MSRGRASAARETGAGLKIESLRFKGRVPYDLAVEPGECVCLTGPSGAGKTLRLRSIADLDPHEGRCSSTTSTASPSTRRGARHILAGSPPVEAVKHQILIMFLIAAGAGFGVMGSIGITARSLFDDRHRLRLERLR
jgi:energy-coupling factor transporter ATP-binding protein EcfA2